MSKTFGRRYFLIQAGRAGMLVVGSSSLAQLLAACGAGVTPPTASPLQPGASPTLSGTLDFWDGPAGEFGINYFIEEFKKLHPNVTINFTAMGGEEEMQRLKSALLAGAGVPDIGGSFEANTQEFLNPEQLTDLTELIKPYAPNITEQSLSVCTTDDGRILAVPADATAAGLLYRKDIAEKYSVNPDDLKTWDDFVRIGKEVHGASNGQVKMLFLNRDDPNLVQLRLMHSELGSGFFSQDGKTVTIDDEANVSSLTLMKKMWDEDIAWKDVTFDAQWGYMEKDQLLALPHLSWMPQVIVANTKQQIGKWQLQRLPAFTSGGNQNARSSGASYMIPKRAKNPEAAWAYLEYSLMRPEAQLTLLQELFLFPSNKKTYELPGFDEPVEFFGGQKANSLWADIYTNSPIYRYTPYFQQALVSVNAVMPKIFNGEVTPAAGLKEAADEVRRRSGLS